MKTRQRIGMKRMISTLALLLAVGTIHTQAATYYVATTGSEGNDGTTWATAVASISNGIAKAVNDGDTVLVSNGIYSVTTDLVVTNAIAVRKFGAGEVVVNGGGVTRCFSLTHSGAVLDGLTVSDGYAASVGGGGIYMTGGTVQNSVIVSNRCANGYLSGSGIYMEGGTVSNCVILKNDTVVGSQNNFGGGVYISGGTLQYSSIVSNRAAGSDRTGGGGIQMKGGVVQNCLIRGNQTVGSSGFYDFSTGGGGVKMSDGVLRNCIVFGNLANAGHADNKGGGVRITGGVIENCTIVRNATSGSTGGGGGVYRDGGTITNCIVVNNTSLVGIINIGSNQAAFSCAPELGTANGNIAVDPGFIASGSGSGLSAAYGNYHLLPRTPCVDTGANLASVTIDYEGNARPLDGNGSGSAITDMGAYEVDPANGPLRCNFFASTNFSFGSVTVVFTAFVEGANTNNAQYYWDFENSGVIDTQGVGLAVVTNTYSTGGLYAVALTVSNAVPEGFTLVKYRMISVVVDADAYVSTTGSNTSPFDTWAKAASNIQEAVDQMQVLVLAGGTHRTVWMTNGTYVLSAPVSITADITLRSTNGPALTLVSGNAAVRCFNIDSAGAVLSGITVTNGLGPDTASGILLNNGTVTNCVIAACRNFRAVNQVNGILSGCWIVNNTVGNGGGLVMSGGTALGCTITNNQGGLSGGGVYMSAGTLADSMVAGNQALINEGRGHGVYMTSGTVTNCVIRNNGAQERDTYAGGVYMAGGNLLGCTVVSNLVWGSNRNSAGGVWLNGAGAVVDRCTIAYNEARGAPNSYINYNGGGGVTIHAGLLRNCLISGNLANGNHSSHLGAGVRMKGGLMENCTIVGNSAINLSDAGGVYNEGGGITNCIVYFNATQSGGTITNIAAGGAVYSCAPELTTGEGNLAGDPLFSNPGSGYGLELTTGDYHLSLVSPCLDTGAPMSWAATAVDLDGNPRLVRALDMGCYETLALRGTIIIIR